MHARLSLPSPHRLFGPGWLAIGFAYWLALVCALEPGNLAGAQTPPPLPREVARLLAAGLLGAAATPAVLALVGVGRARRPSVMVKALGVLVLAFLLVVTSCVLAAWVFEQRPLPRLAELRQELASNYALLVFGLTVFLGLVALAKRSGATLTGDALVFSERGRTLVIARRDILWIESQGNYQAVRALGATQLVRRTLDALEAELDPTQFVRIHRRAIVAVDAVRDVVALSNGDAEACLTDGRIFRVARGRRSRLSAALSRLEG